MTDELKPCPFHNCNTCGCYYSVDIPEKDWQTRPIEDALRAELAALKERTRKRKYPDEKPPKEHVVVVMLDDGSIHDDLICFNGEWLSNDNVVFWWEEDIPYLPEPPEVE